LEERPYLPPITFGIFSNCVSPFANASEMDVTISIYNGSPSEPGSFVLSNTAIFSTDFGSAFNKCFVENGLKSLTLTIATFSPNFSVK